MSFLKKTKAITIDGPAGSGKSTVSRLVAEKMGYVYVDTGAMYRALTLKVMDKNMDFADEDAIADLAAGLMLELLPSGKGSATIRVMMDGRDVSEAIRTMEVTQNVKHVAKIASVRKKLVHLQRKMIDGISGAVMEGRDIGTVVLKDAACKVYLDASFDERVDRRLAELRANGRPVTRLEVANDLKQRDHTDKTRKVGPLKKADDAVLLDTSDLSVTQVVEKIVNYAKDVIRGKRP
ncbi:MAG: (d)CMP kinase [Candidatus Omnitrophica bacterium]|nr:(d)CMP kinase [Candidatus Omnitrophota bacterium]